MRRLTRGSRLRAKRCGYTRLWHTERAAPLVHQRRVDYWMQFEGHWVDSSYRLVELRGNGAFGGVFRSEHVIAGRLMGQVAIKLNLPQSEALE